MSGFPWLVKIKLVGHLEPGDRVQMFDGRIRRVRSTRATRAGWVFVRLGWLDRRWYSVGHADDIIKIPS